MKQLVLWLVTALTLTACGTAHDPYEAANRSWHETNVQLDRAIIKPISMTYGKVVPDPVRKGLSNVSDTLGLPGVVVNDVLQFKLDDALHNTVRFAVNATVGVGGLFDMATVAGVDKRDSDFGETLHVWGVNEGAYVVLPFYGASSERDTVGLIVDIALDPLGSVLDPSVARLPTALKIADIADTRYRYSDLYESVVYDSADGYEQLKIFYLDRRRFELGAPVGQQTIPTEGNPAYDIYEDFYE